MSEADNNATSFNSESLFPNLQEQEQQKYREAEIENQCTKKNSTLESNVSELEKTLDSQDASPAEQELTSESKMNWQKVAHKLREYNRKLLKKVFRLEQELAEIDNRFNKYIEKSQNSDLLLAQQEEQIQNYQQQVTLLSQHLATSQQLVSDHETAINNLSQQHEFSQQQTAQLERDCALLQEQYNQKSYELVTKEKEAKDLQTKLSQQQRHALQYRAELKRYQEQASVIERNNRQNHQNHSSQTKTIQPWSTATTSEPKIPLSKTQLQPMTASYVATKPSETIKTAAEIATWSTSKLTEQPATKTKAKTKSNSATSRKPQSLAAVDLPTFPRPL